MRLALYELLVDPIQGEKLELLADEVVEDSIHTGHLQRSNDVSYPIYAGIPRMVVSDDAGQLQTSDAFGFKWQKRDTYDSLQVKTSSTAWLVEKYGFESLENWASYFNSRSRILDVGCGSGFSSSLWLDSPYWTGAAMWVGVDISLAVDVARERLSHVPNTHFVQANALYLPFAEGSFDTIFSEGVLHHTPSTRQALLAAAHLLESGGEFHFYVYRRKAPVREFTDDYVRREIASLSDAEAWQAMRSLTRLGQVLAETQTTITLEEDIPLLGIKAGEHDIQRLIYWHVAKIFWNSAWSFEENVHVNFDWYRPYYAHRQTAEEVRQWCDEAELTITWFHKQESGFAVRAVKD